MCEREQCRGSVGEPRVEDCAGGGLTALLRLPQHDKQPGTGTPVPFMEKRAVPHHKQPGAGPKDPGSLLRVG